MASICTSCLRTLRTQVRKELQKQPSRSSTNLNARVQLASTSYRTFTSSAIYLADGAPSNKSSKPPPPPPEEPHPYRDKQPESSIQSFASTIRQNSALKQTTEPYIAYGTTSTLLAACNTQISYTIPSAVATPPKPAPQNKDGQDLGEGSGWWYTPISQNGGGLEVTFGSWAQVMMLYLYCLTVRLRAFPEKHARIWQQQLLDHFFYAAEDRMAVWHSISTRSVRNKYLKDLASQWRGVLFSYDEGLIQGDAVLAGAIWRNVFKGDENVDLELLAQATAYLRGQLRVLDRLMDQEISEGKVVFEDPAKYRSLVAKESPMMKKGFSNEELGATKAREETKA